MSDPPTLSPEEEEPLTKRQLAIGVICFLAGVLVGMEIAGMLDVLVRASVIVLILLLCLYLVFPSLLRRTQVRQRRARRMPRKQTQRKP